MCNVKPSVYKQNPCKAEFSPLRKDQRLSYNYMYSLYTAKADQALPSPS